MSSVTASSRWALAQAFIRDVRSPEWGLPGQLFRFALSGGIVAAVYVSVTTVLHQAFAVPFQLALAIGFTVGVALHFTLQRMFVWRHREEFALAVHFQAARYLCMCASQYGVTALSTSQLPSLVGLPVEVVYIATMLTIAVFNFIIFRGRVFHADPPVTHEHTSRRQVASHDQPKREAMS